MDSKGAGPKQPIVQFNLSSELRNNCLSDVGAPLVLATSASNPRALPRALLREKRVLCSDRKGMLDQFRTRALVISVSIFLSRRCTSDGSIFSTPFPHWLPLVFYCPPFPATQTIRVSLTQASSILTKYTTDQLEQETKTEELIVQGDLTEEEANRKNDEWEKVSP